MGLKVTLASVTFIVSLTQAVWHLAMLQQLEIAFYMIALSIILRRLQELVVYITGI
jgi:hypothetical protein